ncbi:MAG: SET domain-containing protein-lysine N-methyltransferase [Verrucomicrobia bacterium]|nr:SET domain-containing protein-lysine N-methyltransferase [Verrucomicrobiota bacterium]
MSKTSTSPLHEPLENPVPKGPVSKPGSKHSEEAETPIGNQSEPPHVGCYVFESGSDETANLLFKPSVIHGTGGFAKHDLQQGTLVVEYIGTKITKQESIERCRAGNEYVFSLDEETDIDGNVDWNPARFLNHSCVPNCEAELIDGHIWIVALRDIKANEEITFDYGYDLEDFRKHPCRCGAAGCAGYIVASELRGSLPRHGPVKSSER